jgi:Predicted alternative thymidylate synthase
MKNKQSNEIKNLRSKVKKTLRVTSSSLENILYKPFKVLDSGFIRVIDYMGDDSAIVQSARVSYGEGTKKVSNDKGLIRYLMKNWHTTPFEMCEIKFHIKLPIFIARQWIRHRTANVNEYSATIFYFR